MFFDRRIQSVSVGTADRRLSIVYILTLTGRDIFRNRVFSLGAVVARAGQRSFRAR